MTRKGYMVRGPDRLQFRSGKSPKCFQVRPVVAGDWHSEEYPVDLLEWAGWVIVEESILHERGEG